MAVFRGLLERDNECEFNNEISFKLRVVDLEKYVKLLNKIVISDIENDDVDLRITSGYWHRNNNLKNDLRDNAYKYISDMRFSNSDPLDFYFLNFELPDSLGMALLILVQDVDCPITTHARPDECPGYEFIKESATDFLIKMSDIKEMLKILKDFGVSNFYIKAGEAGEAGDGIHYLDFHFFNSDSLCFNSSLLSRPNQTICQKVTSITYRGVQRKSKWWWLGRLVRDKSPRVVPLEGMDYYTFSELTTFVKCDPNFLVKGEEVLY